MSIEFFDSGDEPYRKWMEQHEDGYVLNTNRSSDTTYVVLHRSGCADISQLGPNQERGGFTERSYVKVCSQEIDELLEWVSEHRPNAVGKVNVCGNCNPEIEGGEEILDEQERGIDPDSIEELAQTVNRRAEDYEIGDLQEIRKELQGLQRRSHSKIFSQQTIIEDYAYHHGGRTEPQFNLAYRKYEGHLRIRYGLGISLQDSQWSNKSLDEWADDLMEAMRPRVRLFNEYLTANPGMFSGLNLWYEPEGSTVPENERTASPIPERFVEWQNFIFLGKREKPSDISYDEILETFDRLLPLYVYIEENVNSAEPDVETVDTSPAKQPERKHETTTTATKTEIDVDLRHNRIQDELERKLSEEYGAENVESEYRRENGRVDLVVETGDALKFYEIKPYSDPRLCIREAVGQLLEYAYWSGTEEPDRLIVVGESELDEEGEEYLLRLWEKFGLPIEYEHIRTRG